jgi:phosphate:Na+ symporter
MGKDKKKKDKCCEGYLKKGKMCGSCPLKDKEKAKDKEKDKDKGKKKEKKKDKKKDKKG